MVLGVAVKQEKLALTMMRYAIANASYVNGYSILEGLFNISERFLQYANCESAN
ncbi:hypothetical protein NIES3275_19180 [Microchaete diplosiphon NIES-3275]|nr:hypothetical protein NIES3275_19180 [Microchaete diplosiphon NIES-3275]